MRDNQPKMSEAAAASLRSGEVETGRGWRMLNRTVAGWSPASSLRQSCFNSSLSLLPVLCAVSQPWPARCLAPRCRRDLHISLLSLSCSPGRRAADGDTAASRGEVTRTNSNIISLLRPVASVLGGHQAGAAATDRVQTTAASVWTLRGASSMASSVLRRLHGAAAVCPRCPLLPGFLRCDGGATAVWPDS